MPELPQPAAVTRERIGSIDLLRGIVMVIMALDHVRDFFFKATIEGNTFGMDPTNLQTTTPALFFTRWITHVCAPVFVFLAGTSIFMMGAKRSPSELSTFLFKRGLWLILVEVIIITFGWTFNPAYNVILLQVIWAIGMCMVLMGLMTRLPFTLVLAAGALIVTGHNLLDYSFINSQLRGGFLPDLLYFSQFAVYKIFGDHSVLIIYSFVPWLGVMMLGYCCGRLYAPDFDPTRRRQILLFTGLAATVLFIVLRFTNLYGDPSPWMRQTRGSPYTVLSFLNVTKYPPSLLFLSMTLGPALIFMALVEGAKNRLETILSIYGKVPMFYYVLHFYIMHSLLVILFYLSGFGSSDIRSPGNPFFFKPNGFGFNLWAVYAIWLFVVVVLYPLCKKYNRYKSTHRKWWLSYL